MSNEYSVHADAKPATPLPVASPSSVGFSAERLKRIDAAMQADAQFRSCVQRARLR